MKIKVTQSDIDNGKRKDCENCPIALAINKVLKPEYKLKVRTDLIEMNREGYIIRVYLGKEPRTFIINFDYKASVVPFEFELPIDSYCKDEQ